MSHFKRINCKKRRFLTPRPPFYCPLKWWFMNMHEFLYFKRVYSLGFKSRHTISSIYSIMNVCLSVAKKGGFYKIVTSSNTFMIPFIKLIYLSTWIIDIALSSVASAYFNAWFKVSSVSYPSILTTSYNE